MLNAVVPEQVLPSAPFEGRMWAASERGNGVVCGEGRLASCTPYETAGARDRDHVWGLAQPGR